MTKIIHLHPPNQPARPVVESEDPAVDGDVGDVEKTSEFTEQLEHFSLLTVPAEIQTTTTSQCNTFPARLYSTAAVSKCRICLNLAWQDSLHLLPPSRLR